MGKRILGLDLGTNSIGWGVVDDLGAGQIELVKRGVHIFPEGVKIEKGNESSKAAERTGYRAARRLKFRRKLRKVRTLKVLSKAKFCPA
ncbi:MAG: CRISPR-associated protein Csn1, partial [Verrucomicrobia bacterium]|nr:CRISPR-associated protein Csn1 [Verrucomicrobiota bacterium]